jgi:site-specific DNA-methyltransferase (adenine-specific)
MDGFKTYDELKQIDSQYKQQYGSVFNLPDGKKSMSNILEFRKDAGGFHPTQKPVSLIQTIVETYTNPGDLILDNCMGSGTTAIACIKEKRHFIGFELNKEYYEKACDRIATELREPELF